jgi:hypothetical protein
MTRKANTLYLCAVCKKPVYRLGSNTSLLSKLCGKHGRIAKQLLSIETLDNNIGTELKDKRIPIPNEFGSITTVQEQVNYYRRRLLKTERLAEQDKNATFISLWVRTRE